MLKRDTARLKTKEKPEFWPFTLCVAYATQSVYGLVHRHWLAIASDPKGIEKGSVFMQS